MKTSFGEKIKYLRECRGINQTELGKLTHMTQRKISYIETGKFEPGLDDIRELCKCFKVSADYLLDIPKEYKK